MLCDRTEAVSIYLLICVLKLSLVDNTFNDDWCTFENFQSDFGVNLCCAWDEVIGGDSQTSIRHKKLYSLPVDENVTPLLS